MMKLSGKELPVPIIQGGMGVGISLSKLAGAVAKCGGMGVISSANIGFHEPDFETATTEANLRALTREIQKAKEIAGGNGLVGVNIMVASAIYKEYCDTAVAAGADAIISGAGLPLKLPQSTKGSNTLCAPIVSGGRAAALLCKTYDKQFGVIPDFLVLEGHKAGGHLGFKKEDLLNGTAKENDELLAEVFTAIAPYEEKYGKKIPVFVAGGVFDGKDMAHFMKLGAAGVQIATRFIATEECDAADGFKQMIIDAKEEDIHIIQSPVGMPARAIESPLLARLRAGEKYPAVHCNLCLSACPKGLKTPYCISRALVAAAEGDKENGLFFCGENASRVNEMTTVPELMQSIISEWRNEQ